MPRYIVKHRYASQRDGTQWGPWDAGQPIDLREEDADWVNTDSPGCLELDAPKAKPEPAEPEDDNEGERQAKPAANRQHRGGRNRGA